MKMVITINLDTAAFDGPDAEDSLDYILDDLLQEFKGGTREGMLKWRSYMLRDANGNRVGGVEVSK